tara:strand:- start:7323 stop:8468 length:1146 start_codon:yes stop_codon:yes gene_type:complete
MSKYQTKCRHFNGYKPCGKHQVCDEYCPSKDIIENRILIIHLGAIGAVVRTTALLPAIKKQYPKSHITWLTSPVIKPLLQSHPHLDRIATDTFEDILPLSSEKFDRVYCIDKSKKAGGILNHLRFDSLKGFYVNDDGVIVPADADAHYLWENGLSNEIKFYQNKKSEIEMIFEAMGLSYDQDEYCLPLSDKEEALRLKRASIWSEKGRKIIVGINTGCSPVIAYKKLSDANLSYLIENLKRDKNVQVVLLGGPEDRKRNEELSLKLDVISSPTNLGLRDGLVSVAACDLVISGDSLGMHMAISQKKHIVAWFGPTCAHEIELYGRGDKVVSNMSCAPCWKRSCEKQVRCNDLADVESILRFTQNEVQRRLPQDKQVAINFL